VCGVLEEGLEEAEQAASTDSAEGFSVVLLREDLEAATGEASTQTLEDGLVRGLGAFESAACVADEIVGDLALAAVTIGGCKETLGQKRGLRIWDEYWEYLYLHTIFRSTERSNCSGQRLGGCCGCGASASSEMSMTARPNTSLHPNTTAIKAQACEWIPVW
jgi:hypothetical protein